MAPRETTDQGSGSSQDHHPQLHGHLMDEIMSERYKSWCHQPERPGDPHYVGQAGWDTRQGILDLNTGRFDEGEQHIKDAITDLGKEKDMINTAQDGGKKAAQDILNGNTDAAKKDLQDTIDGLKGNGFNKKDSDQFQKALDDLNKGDVWGAEIQIAKAEKTLDDREGRVDKATNDLTTGLDDFNHGQFYKGEGEMAQALKDLHMPADKIAQLPDNPHPIPQPWPEYPNPWNQPNWPPRPWAYGPQYGQGFDYGYMPHVMDASQMGAHSMQFEVPNPNKLYGESAG